MTSVCFTGHRKIDSPDMYALKSLLDSTICGLVKRGVTDFYCVDFSGSDLDKRHEIPENSVSFRATRRTLARTDRAQRSAAGCRTDQS